MHCSSHGVPPTHDTHITTTKKEKKTGGGEGEGRRKRRRGKKEGEEKKIKMMMIKIHKISKWTYHVIMLWKYI